MRTSLLQKDDPQRKFFEHLCRCLRGQTGLRSQFHAELLQFLSREPEPFSVVVMPDFFLDRLVSVKSTTEAFSKRLEGTVRRKGGSLDGIPQKEFRGGNAVNTASALARLGAKVTPIICTDSLGQQLIRHYLNMPNVDLSHVKVRKNASITTALELETAGNGKSNVMLRDVGSLATFGPKDLNSSDFLAIDDADYVCVFNWAGTRRFGTELAKKVFRRVKSEGSGTTYYDTADPTPNARKIPELMKRVLQNDDLDVLSVNENEAITYAQTLERTSKSRPLSIGNLLKNSARTLALKLPATIDLHSAKFSSTLKKNRSAYVDALKVRSLRVTGAGDAWNAGNITGYANKLSDECRLALANAVAAYYISSTEGEHPTRKQLCEFLEKQKPS